MAQGTISTSGQHGAEPCSSTENSRIDTKAVDGSYFASIIHSWIAVTTWQAEVRVQMLQKCCPPPAFHAVVSTPAARLVCTGPDAFLPPKLVCSTDKRGLWNPARFHTAESTQHRAHA